MKYKITIEEIISQEFYIEASDINEAKNIAIERYKNGEIILENAHLIDKKIDVSNELNDELIEWESF